MAGKYTPLEHYLQDLPASQKEVTLSFEQIERILNQSEKSLKRMGNLQSMLK